MPESTELRDEPFAPEIVSTDLGFKGAVWDVRDDRVRYGDGEIRRQYVAHTGAVAILALDDDGRVPVVFFSTDVDAETDIALAEHEGRIEKIVAGLGHMGKTSYHLAMDAVIDHYMDSGSREPALVVFQTDGGPINKLAAERYLCKAAKLPLFWQFVGFGDPGSKQFDFLRKLDELAVPGRRGVDNAGFFHAGADPGKVSDAELYDRPRG